MAGDWIRIEKSTIDKPEITTIAARLGTTPERVFCLCFRLWSWADTHSATGTVPGSTPATVDTLLGLPGLANALIEVGWLSIRSGGEIEFPNFERHMGKNAKLRAAAAERARRYREKKRHAHVTRTKRDAVTFPLLSSSLDSEKEKEEEKHPREGGLGEGGARDAARVARDAPENFAVSAPGLAQAWIFYQRNTRRGRDDLEAVTSFFGELLRQGKSGPELLADIQSGERDRAEYLWEFRRRINGTQSRPGVGFTTRIPTPRDSLARAEGKICRVGQAPEESNGLANPT